MRVLFVGDLQLEAGMPLGSGEYGPGSRFAEQQAMLDWIVDLADRENVELVCVLGDVFELRKPSPWAVIAFQGFLRELTNLNKRVLCILGNHDVKSAALPPALSIFKNDVQVALAPSLYPYAGVVVAALPWAPLATLTAKHQGSRAELQDLAAGALVHAANFLRGRCRDEYPGLPAVLVGHWAVSGAALPTGIPTDQLNEVVVPLSGLTEAAFDLTAFGHIHKTQVLSALPPVFYAGSTMVCSWGETNDPHGVWLYDTASELRFIAAPDKPFITYDYSLEQVRELQESAPSSAATLAGAFVRLRYQASEDEARELDGARLRQALLDQGALRVFLQPKITRAERSRVAELDDQLGPTEAFMMWLVSQDIEDPVEPLLNAHSEYLAKIA